MCVCLQNTQRHLKTKLRETDDGTGMHRRFFGRSFFLRREGKRLSLAPPPPHTNARALPQNRTPLIFKRKRERERRSFLLPVLLLFFPGFALFLLPSPAVLLPRGGEERERESKRKRRGGGFCTYIFLSRRERKEKGDRENYYILEGESARARLY